MSVQNLGCIDATEFINSLEKLGISVIEKESNFDIFIVDNYISQKLEQINKEKLLQKKPWLLLKPTGSIIWIGPIFVPSKNGCWNCLSRYIKENRRAEVDILGIDNSSLDICSKVILPTNQSIAFNFAANELAKWIVNGESTLEKNILTLDSRTLTTQLHSFDFNHVCKICFQSEKKENTEVSLQPSLKEFNDDEGERGCSPEETLERIISIVSPITGVISDVKYLKVNKIHIYYTVRNLPLPKSQNNQKVIRTPDIAVGKSSSKLQAKVSCLAEAIERHNCTYNNQFQIKTTYEKIKEQAIHPNKLLLFSEKQYENRETENLKNGPFNKIPERFDESSTIGWTPLISLINSQSKFIPSSYCYLIYPNLNETEMCIGDSNGCASGNTIEEAITYAILELIERDAFALWWYNRIQRPEVDLKVLKNDHFEKIRLQFAKSDRVFHILDITSDLEVPTFVAVSWQTNGKRIFLGSGSHLDPYKAMVRATNELHQVMTRANIPQDIDIQSFPSIERDFIRWILQETIETQTFMMPNSFKNRSCVFQANDFLKDINFYLEIFKNKNLDVFFLNMSQPGVHFFSVKIVIPTLRYFWSRLGPGRLYEVPVLMDWLKIQRKETQMNPIPYFL